MEQQCKKCNKTYTLTKDNFGHTPSGNFRKECRACMRANVAKHSKSNPDLVLERAAQRKKLVSNAAQHKNYDSADLIKTLFYTQQGTCYYCRESIELDNCDIEHKTPISKNGSDTKENIVLSCYRCNKEKHNKTVEEYRAWKTKNGYAVLF